MSWLSEKKLKFFFSSVIVLFVLQEVLVYRYISEPYPALRMPPFYGNNMNEDGFYETKSVKIKITFENNDPLLLTPRELFYNAPTSLHWSLISKFQPIDEKPGTTPYKRFEMLEPIIPGFFTSRQRSLYEVQHNPETLKWLREQIGMISPDKNPEKISFNWYKDLYSPDNLLNQQRELIGKTTIFL
ncbi:hypothetical protein [Fodinibius sp. SL11]|uniref:hypothetical protein n=1 Tax=Fodinibius sp. SL11 TaxID=3425690 RepID=UPI003F881405